MWGWAGTTYDRIESRPLWLASCRVNLGTSKLDCDRGSCCGCLASGPPSITSSTYYPLLPHPVAPFILRVGLLKHSSRENNAFWPTIFDPRTLPPPFVHLTSKSEQSNRSTFAPSSSQFSHCCSILWSPRRAFKKLDTGLENQAVRSRILSSRLRISTPQMSLQA